MGEIFQPKKQGEKSADAPSLTEKVSGSVQTHEQIHTLKDSVESMRHEIDVMKKAIEKDFESNVVALRSLGARFHRSDAYGKSGEELAAIIRKIVIRPLLWDIDIVNGKNVLVVKSAHSTTANEPQNTQHNKEVFRYNFIAGAMTWAKEADAELALLVSKNGGKALEKNAEDVEDKKTTLAEATEEHQPSVPEKKEMSEEEIRTEELKSFIESRLWDCREHFGRHVENLKHADRDFVCFKEIKRVLAGILPAECNFDISFPRQSVTKDWDFGRLFDIEVINAKGEKTNLMSVMLYREKGDHQFKMIRSWGKSSDSILISTFTKNEQKPNQGKETLLLHKAPKLARAGRAVSKFSVISAKDGSDSMFPFISIECATTSNGVVAGYSQEVRFGEVEKRSEHGDGSATIEFVPPKDAPSSTPPLILAIAKTSNVFHWNTRIRGGSIVIEALDKKNSVTWRFTEGGVFLGGFDAKGKQLNILLPPEIYELAKAFLPQSSRSVASHVDQKILAASTINSAQAVPGKKLDKIIALPKVQAFKEENLAVLKALQSEGVKLRETSKRGLAELRKHPDVQTYLQRVLGERTVEPGGVTTLSGKITKDGKATSVEIKAVPLTTESAAVKEFLSLFPLVDLRYQYSRKGAKKELFMLPDELRNIDTFLATEKKGSTYEEVQNALKAIHVLRAMREQVMDPGMHQQLISLAVHSTANTNVNALVRRERSLTMEYLQTKIEKAAEDYKRSLNISVRSLQFATEIAEQGSFYTWDKEPRRQQMDRESTKAEVQFRNAGFYSAEIQKLSNTLSTLKVEQARRFIDGTMQNERGEPVNDEASFILELGRANLDQHFLLRNPTLLIEVSRIANRLYEEKKFFGELGNNELYSVYNLLNYKVWKTKGGGFYSELDLSNKTRDILADQMIRAFEGTRKMKPEDIEDQNKHSVFFSEMRSSDTGFNFHRQKTKPFAMVDILIAGEKDPIRNVGINSSVVPFLKKCPQGNLVLLSRPKSIQRYSEDRYKTEKTNETIHRLKNGEVTPYFMTEPKSPYAILTKDDFAILRRIKVGNTVQEVLFPLSGTYDGEDAESCVGKTPLTLTPAQREFVEYQRKNKKVFAMTDELIDDMMQMSHLSDSLKRAIREKGDNLGAMDMIFSGSSRLLWTGVGARFLVPAAMKEHEFSEAAFHLTKNVETSEGTIIKTIELSPEPYVNSNKQETEFPVTRVSVNATAKRAASWDEGKKKEFRSKEDKESEKDVERDNLFVLLKTHPGMRALSSVMSTISPMYETLAKTVQNSLNATGIEGKSQYCVDAVSKIIPGMLKAFNGSGILEHWDSIASLMEKLRGNTAVYSDHELSNTVDKLIRGYDEIRNNFHPKARSKNLLSTLNDNVRDMKPDSFVQFMKTQGLIFACSVGAAALTGGVSACLELGLVAGALVSGTAMYVGGEVGKAIVHGWMREGEQWKPDILYEDGPERAVKGIAMQSSMSLFFGVIGQKLGSWRAEKLLKYGAREPLHFGQRMAQSTAKALRYSEKSFSAIDKSLEAMTIPITKIRMFRGLKHFFEELAQETREETLEYLATQVTTNFSVDTSSYGDTVWSGLGEVLGYLVTIIGSAKGPGLRTRSGSKALLENMVIDRKSNSARYEYTFDITKFSELKKEVDAVKDPDTTVDIDEGSGTLTMSKKDAATGAEIIERYKGSMAPAFVRALDIEKGDDPSVDIFHLKRDDATGITHARCFADIKKPGNITDLEQWLKRNNISIYKGEVTEKTVTYEMEYSENAEDGIQAGTLVVDLEKVAA